MPEFQWDENRRLAAQLIAEGELADKEIAARVGVSRQSLWKWRQEPEFTAGVEAEIDRINTSLRKRAISHIERRVASLNERWLRLWKVVEERAGAPEMALAPGGTTGLLCHTQKSLGSGETATIVDEYEVDAGLLKELREIEKQAAQELGQWVERHNIDAEVKSYEATNTPDDL